MLLKTITALCVIHTVIKAYQKKKTSLDLENSMLNSSLICREHKLSISKS